jgi:hypothetical protein
MAKKRIGKTMLIAVLLLAGGVVVAVAPLPPEVYIDPIGTLSYATFPQTYDVTGTLYGYPNIDAVAELKLFINNVQEGATQDPTGAGTSTSFSLPWNITGPGTYDVKVTARHGGDTGEDTETVLVEQTVVVLYYPAAPAIAAHYLKSLGVKAGSPTYTNIVSQVARYMGPETDFDGVAKEDAAYEETVEDYVDYLLSLIP